MNWRTHIHSDPNVLMGKPVVKGTRLAVDFILDLLAEGWTLEAALVHPGASEEGILIERLALR
jgi:uncharacterized protein (DUF433 family)